MLPMIPNETLVGATDKQVVEMCAAIELFFGGAINGAIVVACESYHSGGGKTYRYRSHDDDNRVRICTAESVMRFVPAEFFEPVLLFHPDLASN